MILNIVTLLKVNIWTKIVEIEIRAYYLDKSRYSIFVHELSIPYLLLKKLVKNHFAISLDAKNILSYSKNNTLQDVNYHMETSLCFNEHCGNQSDTKGMIITGAQLSYIMVKIRHLDCAVLNFVQLFEFKLLHC